LYRFVIYIKAVSYENLVQGKDLLEAYLFANPPKQAYVQFDFDPMNQI